MMHLKQQQGAVLIVVLMILIMVTTLGALAIRQGVTRLNISTNSQISTVLSTANDNVARRTLEYLQTSFAQQTSPIGALRNKDDIGRHTEILFCYNPINQPVVYQFTSASMVAPQEGQTPGSKLDNEADVTYDPNFSGVGPDAGRCNLQNTAMFNSLRGLGVTQVSISPIEGPRVNEVVRKYYRLIVTSIAVTPFTGDVATVQSVCMNTRLSNDLDVGITSGSPSIARESLSECLAFYGVPSESKVQDFYIDFDELTANS